MPENSQPDTVNPSPDTPRAALEGRFAVDEESPGKDEPAYFQLSPRSRPEGFHRADGAHERTLEWIARTEELVLFLTGHSGTGKSSIIEAWVRPHLHAHQHQTILIRHALDPVQALVADSAATESPEDEAAEAYRRLSLACQRIRPRSLLLVIDQLEAFLLAHRELGTTPFNRLFLALRERPIPGLKLLLVLDGEYGGLLDSLALPARRQEENWREVSPFTLDAARAFVQESGLVVGPLLLKRLVEECSQIDRLHGLARPITLNLLGLALQRRSRTTFRKRHRLEARKLISDDVLAALADQRRTPRVLRQLIDGRGDRTRGTAADIGQRAGLPPEVVQRCLQGLESCGLVRRIPVETGVWEVSHEAVAGHIHRALETRRPGLGKNLLHPRTAALALLLALVIAAVALVPQRPLQTGIRLQRQPSAAVAAQGEPREDAGSREDTGSREVTERPRVAAAPQEPPREPPARRSEPAPPRAQPPPAEVAETPPASRTRPEPPPPRATTEPAEAPAEAAGPPAPPTAVQSEADSPEAPHTEATFRRPRIVHGPAPPYTIEALEAGIEGVVTLQGVVREDGTLIDLEVISGLPLGLSESALATARQWRFEPATIGGRPLVVPYRFSVRFVLGARQPPP